jgi:cytochrome c oxidase accessory protein FixG
MKRSGDGALAPDGSRVRIEPAPVRGRFDRARRIGFVLLIGVYLTLPLVTIEGRPALCFDLATRRFYVFGALFDATDAWRLAFVLLVVATSLLFLTAAVGRVWCGWACPQTVFLDALIRPLERLFSRHQRSRRRRVVHAIVRHGSYLAVAAVCAHAFLAYFIPPAKLGRMIVHGPAAEPATFVFALIATLLLYVDFAWFREQLCLVICPYGRLQGVMVDKDSLVIGYDERRGEPRGKATVPGAGDCVDCRRCIAVCPTAIDIRRGQQLDCVACTACIDACDEIMVKLERPRGLIRFDSENGLAGKPRRFFRPRIFLYGTALLAAVLGLVFATLGRAGVDVQILRKAGTPWTLVGDDVENQFQVVVTNKGAEPLAAPLELRGAVPVEVPTRLQLEPLGRIVVPVRVRFPRSAASRTLRVTVAGESTEATLLAPGDRR